jgi:hypothetical protein
MLLPQYLAQQVKDGCNDEDGEVAFGAGKIESTAGHAKPFGHKNAGIFPVKVEGMPDVMLGIFDGVLHGCGLSL